MRGMSRSCHRATFSSHDLRVRSHHAGQSADLLAGDGVALVRHGRRAFLFLAEILFHIANFSALQVTNLDGNLIRRGGDDRRCGGYIERVPVTLDDLRRHCRARSVKALADLASSYSSSRCAAFSRRAAHKLAYAHFARTAILKRSMSRRTSENQFIASSRG